MLYQIMKTRRHNNYLFWFPAKVEIFCLNDKDDNLIFLII